MKNTPVNHSVKWRLIAKKWSLIFMAMFLFAQTEGILHAEIHHFHEHEASCDIFENLAQPYSSATHVSIVEHLQLASDAYLVELSPLFHKVHIDYFYGRAPPLS